MDAVLRDTLVRFPGLLWLRLGYVDDDMVQDGREAMLRAAPRYDETSPASFATWLGNRGVWDALDKHRGRGRHGARRTRSISFRELSDADQQIGDGRDPFDDICQRVDDEPRVRIAVAVLAEMSVRDQDVIRRYVAGEPGTEIASSHGIDPARVSQIAAKFRKTATTRLKEAA